MPVDAFPGMDPENNSEWEQTCGITASAPLGDALHLTVRAGELGNTLLWLQWATRCGHFMAF